MLKVELTHIQTIRVPCKHCHLKIVLLIFTFEYSYIHKSMTHLNNYKNESFQSPKQQNKTITVQ